MEEETKLASKINIMKIAIFVFIVICTIFVLTRYLTNDEFRNMVDTQILKKEITENSSHIIEIDSDGNPYIHAYDKYIVVLSKNVDRKSVV